MQLTDGHRTVSALEYKPISCLNTRLTTGVKLLISGPMRCVNHILFLEEKNVKIIGGEVNSMSVDNAYENVLRRILHLPINRNPNTEYSGEK